MMMMMELRDFLNFLFFAEGDARGKDGLCSAKRQRGKQMNRPHVLHSLLLVNRTLLSNKRKLLCLQCLRTVLERTLPCWQIMEI